MSGSNTSDKIRWSCHFRFNNLDEESFINRSFSHPYLYKSIDDLITENFPKLDDVKSMFKESKE